MGMRVKKSSIAWAPGKSRKETPDFWIEVVYVSGKRRVMGYHQSRLKFVQEDANALLNFSDVKSATVTSFNPLEGLSGEHYGYLA